MKASTEFTREQAASHLLLSTVIEGILWIGSLIAISAQCSFYVSAIIALIALCYGVMARNKIWDTVEAELFVLADNNDNLRSNLQHEREKLLNAEVQLDDCQIQRKEDAVFVTEKADEITELKEELTIQKERVRELENELSDIRLTLPQNLSSVDNVSVGIPVPLAEFANNIGITSTVSRMTTTTTQSSKPSRTTKKQTPKTAKSVAKRNKKI